MTSFILYAQILFLLFTVPCIVLTNTEHKHLNKNVLNGMEISVLGFDYKPICFNKKYLNGNYSSEGWGPDFLSWATKYFNMTTKYVLADMSELQKSGIVNGLIKEMERKHADVIPMGFPASPENFANLSFTLPLYLRYLKFLQPYPNEESRVNALIRPYSGTVWFTFVCTNFVFIGFMSFFARLKNYPGRRTSAWDTVHDQIVYVVTIITLQGNSICYSVHSYVRILTSAWLLAMVVVIYAYTGLLTAMLTIPKFEPIINTWEELAASSRFRITQLEDGNLATQFLSATNGTFKILGDQIRKDPKLLAKDNFQMVENILNHDCVSPSATILVNYVAYEDLKASGKCRMTTSNKELPLVYLIHFGFAKGTLLPKFWDRYFMPYMESSGLTKFLDDQYFPPVDRCRVNQKQSNVLKPISLSNLVVVFVLFLIGIALSLIAFLCEILISCIKNWALKMHSILIV